MSSSILVAEKICLHPHYNLISLHHQRIPQWQPDSRCREPVTAIRYMRSTCYPYYSCFSQVVSELSSRLCCLCREPTNGFFVLTCTRVCISCFQTDERVKMCSLRYTHSMIVTYACGGECDSDLKHGGGFGGLVEHVVHNRI